jgi:hypothetical protein
MDQRKRMRNRDKKIFQIAVGRIIRKRRGFKGENMEELAWNIGIDPKHLNAIGTRTLRSRLLHTGTAPNRIRIQL